LLKYPFNSLVLTVNESIIAITGLGGRGFSSWANNEGEMWLRDYLPADIPGIRVMIYGYPSKLEKSNSRARLTDYTIQFHQILQSARHSQKVSKKNQDSYQ
jgi:hypothetical protein